MGLNLDFISNRRRKMGLKQAELAEMLGMGATDYCKYENGIYKLNAEMIPTLARALRCPIVALFKEEIPEPIVAPKVEKEKPPLRQSLEAMTLKLIDGVSDSALNDINPDLVKEIRENVRALGYLKEGMA
jgi:transcriptional regulator with XRE-family HTH domain